MAHAVNGPVLGGGDAPQDGWEALFLGQKRGASIDYLRFSIYDWVETLIFGRKTRVKPSIMSAMGLRIGVFGRKKGVRR